MNSLQAKPGATATEPRGANTPTDWLRSYDETGVAAAWSVANYHLVLMAKEQMGTHYDAKKGHDYLFGKDMYDLRGGWPGGAMQPDDFLYKTTVIMLNEVDAILRRHQ